MGAGGRTPGGKALSRENQDNFGHRLAGGQDTLAVISHPRSTTDSKVHNIPRAPVHTGGWNMEVVIDHPGGAYWHLLIMLTDGSH